MVKFATILCLTVATQLITAAPATAACDAERDRLAAATSGFDVKIRAPDTLRVGDKVELRWGQVTGLGETPLYLVVGMPSYVRFEGTYRTERASRTGGDVEPVDVGPGFLALPAGTTAPHGMTFAVQQMRAIVPLHRDATGGQRSLSIKPFRRGPLALEWTLVASTSCGEMSIGKPSKTVLEVRLGKPQFVVQENFTLSDAIGASQRQQAGPSQPGKGGSRAAQAIEPSAPASPPVASPKTPGRSTRIVSNSGEFVIEAFADRYTVYEAKSGVALIERAGQNPNFSPTSRFVATTSGGARVAGDASVEIVDLISASVVATITGPIVGWSHGDSLIYAGGLELQQFSILTPLVDRASAANPVESKAKPLSFMGMGRESDAWNSVNLFVSIEQGAFVVHSTGFGISLLDLYTGKLRDLEESAVATTLAREYGVKGYREANGWRSDAKIGLSHIAPSRDTKEGRDFGSSSRRGTWPRQADHLVAHKTAVPAVPSATNKSVETIRSAWAPARRYRGEPQDQIAISDRLREYGANLSECKQVSPSKLKAFDGSNGLYLQWPSELLQKLIAASPKKFAEHKDNGFLYGHWPIVAQGRSYHVFQYSTLPSFAWEAPHPEVTLVEEQGNQFRRVVDLTVRDAKGEIAGRIGQKNWDIRKIGLRIADCPENTLLIAAPLDDRIRLIDLSRFSSQAEIPSPQADLVASLALTTDRRSVLQFNQDGRLFLYDAKSGRAVISGRYADDELILHDDKGYYAATYEGAHFVHLRFPGEPGLYGFNQFASRLERPEAVRNLIAGKGSLLPVPNLAIPPTVDLRLDDVGTSLTAKLTAYAGDGLAAIRLYQDGQLTNEIPAANNDANVAVPVQRLKNARWISAVAADRNGVLSQPASVFLRPASGAGPVLRAVIAGVDLYQSAELRRLSFAVSDAKALSTALTDVQGRYYSAISRVQMENADATPARIIEALASAIEQSSHGDTLLLSFAGHGVKGRDGKYYLATSATDMSNLRDTALAWSAVTSTLQRAKGIRILVFLDACHSGLSGAQSSTNDESVASIMSGARAPILIFAASKGRQVSLETAAQKGGVFTRAVVDTLTSQRASHDANRNGVLEVSEFYRAVKARVLDATGGKQTPWLARTDLIGDFALF